MTGYLDKVYGARTPDDTRDLYGKWAASYDAEVAGHGYVTPRRCAEALRSYVEDPAEPVLDFGCGTGLSGLALRAAGFSVIDGVDLSEDMIAQARAKGHYRSLQIVQADAAPPDGYAVIAAIGVIGAGAAPIEALHGLLQSLQSGGKIVFSFNDHTLQDPAFVAGVSQWADAGRAQILFKEYGEHLPGIGLMSTVYVVQKA